MKRVARGLRGGLPALVALAAGCASPSEAGTSAYVLGTIFILVGLALGVALIFSLNSD